MRRKWRWRMRGRRRCSDKFQISKPMIGKGRHCVRVRPAVANCGFVLGRDDAVVLKGKSVENGRCQLLLLPLLVWKATEDWKAVDEEGKIFVGRGPRVTASLWPTQQPWAEG